MNRIKQGLRVTGVVRLEMALHNLQRVIDYLKDNE